MNPNKETVSLPATHPVFGSTAVFDTFNYAPAVKAGGLLFIAGQVFIYEHCLPFNVSRAYDEASGIGHPQIWTAARDRDMWDALQ